eukprot:CAMPEP_0118985816 /NCGR_PEP_ID=MMETSP1173-20130426/40844_1 /TAXON_ID=1034831 /ORGANISM="Rhizochromulina marina cf, Strain CCMP1243" /LENGTH=44 /DNA_ID= /DNA_START= /DNA_END= /DNA_ORIENTATION=
MTVAKRSPDPYTGPGWVSQTTVVGMSNTKPVFTMCAAMTTVSLV